MWMRCQVLEKLCFRKIIAEVMDSDRGPSIDRISNLPDAVLCHILSFLPTKCSLGTSILSRRWRYLWGSIPNLNFNEGLLFSERDIKRAMKFVHFVNRVLLLNDVSCIQKFELKCGNYCEAFIHTWICTAIKRNVQELNLFFYMEKPVNLPHLLFTCETLVFLKLESEIGLDIPSSVWLPSLKILHLSAVKYMSDNTTQKLLCGCPVLEELFIERWYSDKQWDFNVSSPTLKHLKVKFVLEESDNHEYKLVINAPNLVYLELNDSGSDKYLVGNLSSLVKAYICVDQCSDRFVGARSYGECLYKLLSRVSGVKFLSLSDGTMSSLSEVDGYNLPKFHNMTHLKFGVGGDLGWKFLFNFLESSPNLEFLILKENMSIVLDDEQWTPPLRVPDCLVLRIKEIEIEDIQGEEYELEAIGYMLENAKVLKKMAVNCKYVDLEKKSCVCKKLSKFPRGSRKCRLILLF